MQMLNKIGEIQMAKKKSFDILTEKTAKLESLNKDANDAVDLVNRTISRLSSINQETQDTIDEIDSYCANLMEVKNKLSKNKVHNAAIISNFSKLLNVADDECESTI